MTKLQECLYQYIAEDRYPDLMEDEAFMMVRRQLNEAEERLTASMTSEQKRLFNRYMDEENHIISLQLRHIFRETLTIVHDILNVSL